MDIRDFKYCVAIRTLGQAGVMYQRELDSLNSQTIKPEKILVYLAEGYDKPKETIGWETVIYAKKGMVAQRALNFDEITTPYVLFLDDDVYLPNDGVEKLAKGLLEHNGDCIAADTFPNHKMSVASKILAFVTNWAYPHYSSKWAIKVQHNGSFSYNNNPTKDVYYTQSAAGPCSLWRLEAFRSIHFPDEMWLDRLGFAYGEDLLCYHKLYVNGGKMLMHYTSGVKHLDAQSSRAKYNADPIKLRKRARAWFILWWRIDYTLNNRGVWHRVKSLLSFSAKCVWGLFLHLVYSLVKLSSKPLIYFIKGNVDGYKFVHSDAYKNVPNFIVK